MVTGMLDNNQILLFTVSIFGFTMSYHKIIFAPNAGGKAKVK